MIDSPTPPGGSGYSSLGTQLVVSVYKIRTQKCLKSVNLHKTSSSLRLK